MKNDIGKASVFLVLIAIPLEKDMVDLCHGSFLVGSKILFNTVHCSSFKYICFSYCDLLQKTITALFMLCK